MKTEIQERLLVMILSRQDAIGMLNFTRQRSAIPGSTAANHCESLATTAWNSTTNFVFAFMFRDEKSRISSASSAPGTCLNWPSVSAPEPDVAGAESICAFYLKGARQAIRHVPPVRRRCLMLTRTPCNDRITFVPVRGRRRLAHEPPIWPLRSVFSID